MQKVDWKLVYAKAAEIYPRYRKGLPYSQLETELLQQGLNKPHIDNIMDELVKMQLDQRQKQVNWPLVLFAVVVAVGLIWGLIYLVERGYILIGAGIFILLFIVLKMVFRRRHRGRSAISNREKGKR